MSTTREQIMQAVVAKLNAKASLTGRVYRSREAAVQREEVPVVILTPDGEEVLNDATLAYTDKNLSITVDVFHRGDTPDSLADPYVSDVHAALMADPFLGGLAIDTTEAGTSWDLADADQDAVVVHMKYVIHYRHQRATL